MKKYSWLVGSLAALVFVLYGLGSTLWPLVISSLMAYFLFPVVQKLEERKIKRDWAIFTVFGFVFFIFALTTALVLPGLVRDTKEFFVQLPGSFANLASRFDQATSGLGIPFGVSQEQIQTFIQNQIQDAGAKIASAMGLFLTATFSSVFNWILAILNVFLIPVFFYYIMSDYEQILTTFAKIIPSEYHERIHKVASPVFKVLKGYIRGQGTLCLALAAYYSIALSVIQLNFGFVIGLLTGVLSLIPYVGFTTGFIFALAVALTNYEGAGGVIAVLIVYGIGQVVESFYLTPKLVGGNLGLSPLVSLLVLIIGGNIAGLFGMLIAIPIAACVKIYFESSFKPV